MTNGLHFCLRRKMDTRQLRYIKEIAESGSISKAAEKLYISQSGLNQQLIRIEKELGISLFDRSTHHLKTTEAGEILIHYAKNAINLEDQMKGMIEDVIDGNAGLIRLNLAMELGIELFGRIFPIFQKKYPKVEIRLYDHIVYDQYDLLLNGELDIGMVFVKVHDIPEMEYIHLTSERFLLGVPDNHPLAALYVPTNDGDYPEIDLSLCRGEPFSLMFSGSTFRQVIDPCFQALGFAPNVMFETRTNNVAAMMVKSGICLTILPESQVKLYKDIKWFRLTENPTWECCLIYPKDLPPRKAGRYLVKLAVQESQHLSVTSSPVWS